MPKEGAMSKIAHCMGWQYLAVISTISLVLALASCAPAMRAEPNRKQELIEREAFIRKAMEEQQGLLPWMMRVRVSTLVPFADWDFYFVTDPIGWWSNAGQNFQPVLVPTGFVTDLASIPRVFWQLLRPEGRYAYAAVVHDYLYWTQTRPREEADEIFKIAMEDSKVDSRVIKTIYQAVREFGQGAWDDNARLRKAGERRILKRFPNDFTVAWSDWKKQPDVFANE